MTTKHGSAPSTNPKHDPDFLSQLPEWEHDYKTSGEQLIHYTPEQWKTAKAEFSVHDLRILGEAVMEDWEEPYMRVLAEIATSRGGTILEIGFGMGISARFVQAASVKRHIIIDANHDVACKANEWAKTCAIETEVLEGLWQDVICRIPDDSIDGILFDSYPLTEKELYQNHFDFFPYAFSKLKKGGVLTYYSDEITWFSEIHLRRLIQAGFDSGNIGGSVVYVNPPEKCDYWKSQTILAPIVHK